MKKTIILTMILFMAININVYSKSLYEEGSLTDIQNHWAKNDISYLIEKGCINGYLDKTFKPDWSISVAEFTKILVTSLGYTYIQNSDMEHWAINYIKKAEELKIILPGEFNIIDSYNESITRGEIARMITRVMEEEYPKNIDLYKKQILDYNYINSNYQDYVLKAYTKGIITGYEDSSFKDTNKATRAESTTMIVRMLDADRRIIPQAPVVRSEEVTKTEMEQIVERLREYPTNSKDGDTFEEDNNVWLTVWGDEIIEIYQDAVRNMKLLHNRDYRTLNATQYKNQLKYYLQDTWIYEGIKYKNPLDFIDKYIQETMNYKVIVESEFITDEKLIHSNKRGNPTIRGIFRFKYTSHENTENIINELELLYVANQGYPEKFKLNQWYEVDVDIHLSGYKHNENVTWDTSTYMFSKYEYLSEFKEIEIK